MLILVVDNEGRHPDHVRDWLEMKWRQEWGRSEPIPEIRGAHSYHEALKILASEGSQVRVVLTDVLLSRVKEECGPALFWFVKDKWPTVKLFLTSAYLHGTIREDTGYNELPSEEEGDWQFIDGRDRDWCELNWLHRALFNCDAPEESPSV